MPRIDKKDILDLENRRSIYNFILKNPGLHIRELSRRLEIPKTTLKYHLKYLEVKNLVNYETKGKCTRYFAKFEIGTIDKKVLGVIRQEIPRRIIFLTFIFDEVFIDEISEGLEIPITTISFHLKKLKDMNVLITEKKNKRVAYSLQNRNYIYDLFIRYKDSLFDDPIFSAFLVYIKDEMPENDPIENKHYKEQYYDDLEDIIFDIFQIPFRA